MLTTLQEAAQDTVVFILQSSVQDSPWYHSPVTLISVIIVPVIVPLAVIFFKIIKDLQKQRQEFMEGHKIAERDDIGHRLNNFYGPFRELRAESMLLYDVFALKEKKEQEKNGKYFRTLRYLADGNDFSDQDQAILKEILEIAKKQLALIEKEGWAITNLHLTELLGCLGAHIRILLLAADGKLDGMADQIESMVFPLEVDGAIESETRKLQDSYDKLLSDHKSKQIEIDTDRAHRDTIKYYDENAREYYLQTAYLDLKSLYEKVRGFKKQLPRGGCILDAGCGVGRDTRYFMKHGYKVVSFDASREMVRLCKQYPFAYCLHMSFEDLTLIEEFDCVWACSSLVHVQHSKFENVLHRLVDATKSGGIIFLSLMSGQGWSKKNGKTFYYYDKDAINEIAERLGLRRLSLWKNKSKKQSDPVYWMNFLYEKRKVISKVKGINR